MKVKIGRSKIHFAIALPLYKKRTRVNRKIFIRIENIKHMHGHNEKADGNVEKI